MIWVVERRYESLPMQRKKNAAWYGRPYMLACDLIADMWILNDRISEESEQAICSKRSDKSS